jgi:hypothetical protein
VLSSLFKADIISDLETILPVICLTEVANGARFESKVS